MRNDKSVGVIIPALDEEGAIGQVIAAIPDWVDSIVVVDNGSQDRTIEIASAAGATVINEPERGYGAACLKGIATIGHVDIIVFLDGDNSDYPEEISKLVGPIAVGTQDFVVGSRVSGTCEPGALTPQQRYGNGLACFLMRVIWGARYTDLGPFRAIRRTSLEQLEMADRNYGWTVEMQIRAVQHDLRIMEVPVSYRNRIGHSKVSGTVKGTILAGVKILSVIARFALRPAPSVRRLVNSAVQ